MKKRIRASLKSGSSILCSVGPGQGALLVPDICCELSQAGHEVEVILEPGAENFVGPASFTRCASVVKAPDRSINALLFAPAAADGLARLACGIGGGPAAIAYFEGTRPVVVAPELDPGTAEHHAVQKNLQLLREDGCLVVEGPDGSLADPEELVTRVLGALDGPLEGLRVLISTGGTREPVDSVRFVGNRSSGKMGVAVAREAARMGADVTVVAANVEGAEPGVRWIPVETVDELGEAVMGIAGENDVLVMAAAVSDFKPDRIVEQKIRRGEGLSIEFVPTEDILKGVREENPGLFMVGFAATHGDPVPDAREKLKAKGVELVVGNDISQEGIGFGAEENEVYIVSAEDERFVSRTSKDHVARVLLEEVAKKMKKERQT